MSDWGDWQTRAELDRERDRTREADRQLRIAHAVVRRLLNEKPISPELMKEIMLYAKQPYTYHGTVDHSLNVDAAS